MGAFNALSLVRTCGAVSARLLLFPSRPYDRSNHSFYPGEITLDAEELEAPSIRLNVVELSLGEAPPDSPRVPDDTRL
jgi:hypothetical protein